MIVEPRTLISRLIPWAFALNVVPLVLLIVRNAPWVTGDSARYGELCESLLNGNGFGLGEGDSFEPEGWRLPGYPLFIAACRLVTGDGSLAVVIIQGALFLGSVWFVHKAAMRTFGELTGFIFLVLSGLYPFVAYIGSQVSPEMPCVFLVSVAFYLLCEPTTGRAGMAALLIGLSAYFRANLILLTPALAVAVVLMNRRNYGKALLMVVIASIVALPWAVRNYQVFGVFTPMPAIKGSGAGMLLATWQSRVSVRSLNYFQDTSSFNSEAKSSGMADQISSLNRRLGAPENTVFITLESYPGNDLKLKADTLFAATAIANVKEHPIQYVLSCLVNFWRMWFAAYFPENIPAIIQYALLANGFLALVVAAVGVIITLRTCDERKKPALILVITMFLYFSVTLCWLHTEARYTIPARLPLLMFAAEAVAFVVGRVSIGRSAKLTEH